MKEFPLWRSPRAGLLGAALMALPMIVFSLSPLLGGYLIALILFAWPTAVCLAGLCCGSLPMLMGTAGALLAMGRVFGQQGLLLTAVYLLPVLAAFLYVIVTRTPFKRGCVMLIVAHVVALAAVFWLLQQLAGGDLYGRAGQLAMEGLQTWELGDTLLYEFYAMRLLELPASLAEGALVQVPGGYTLSDAARADLLLSAKALVTAVLPVMVPSLLVRQSILGGVGCLLLPLRLGGALQSRREGTEADADVPDDAPSQDAAEPSDATTAAVLQSIRRPSMRPDPVPAGFPDLGMPPFRAWHLPRGIGWQVGLALVLGYMLQVSAVPALAVAGAMLYAAAGAVFSVQGAALINFIQHTRGTKRFWRILVPLLLLSTSLLLIAGVFDQITNVRGLRKPREPKEEI